MGLYLHLYASLNTRPIIHREIPTFFFFVFFLFLSNLSCSPLYPFIFIGVKWHAALYTFILSASINFLFKSVVLELAICPSLFFIGVKCHGGFYVFISCVSLHARPFIQREIRFLLSFPSSSCSSLWTCCTCACSLSLWKHGLLFREKFVPWRITQPFSSPSSFCFPFSTCCACAWTLPIFTHNLLVREKLVSWKILPIFFLRFFFLFKPVGLVHPSCFISSFHRCTILCRLERTFPSCLPLLSLSLSLCYLCMQSVLPFFFHQCKCHGRFCIFSLCASLNTRRFIQREVRLLQDNTTFFRLLSVPLFEAAVLVHAVCLS